jgi:hypothetical protein
MATTAAPFDLNQAIQQWRESLNASPAFRRENLDELESHLRDSIANLGQRGLAADEAFLIATRRVGSGAALGAEFGKINAQRIWLNRGLWMLIGIQIFICIGCLESAITFGADLGVRVIGRTSLTPLCSGLLCAFAHLLTFAVVLTIGRRIFLRKYGSISAWLRKVPNSSARLIASGLTLMVLARVISGTVYPLYYRFSSPTIPAQMAGISIGTICSSLLESSVLIILTLLLARRQLLAKTCA